MKNNNVQNGKVVDFAKCEVCNPDQAYYAKRDKGEVY